MAHAALILTAVMMLLVSAWSAWSVPEVAGALVRLAEYRLSGAGAGRHRGNAGRDLAAHLDGRDTDTFALAMGVFLLGFLGLAVSLWPYVVPRHFTIWDGMADPRAWFVGTGLAIIIPIVLAYQGTRLLGVPRKDGARDGLWRRGAPRGPSFRHPVRRRLTLGVPPAPSCR